MGSSKSIAKKTILVGPNEAGKSALLQALQQLNAPDDVKPLSALRDYPRSSLIDVTSGKINPTNVPVVTGWFKPDDEVRAHLPASYQGQDILYECVTYLDGSKTHSIVNGPKRVRFSDIEDDLLRLIHFLDKDSATDEKPSAAISSAVSGLIGYSTVTSDTAEKTLSALKAIMPLIPEDNGAEIARYSKLRNKLETASEYDFALEVFDENLPVIVLFNNYFRVRPIIHLGKLAQRVASKSLDDEQYDYGNLCLLKLLGLDAKTLSEMGKSGVDNNGHFVDLTSIRDKLDERQYQLNAASIRLTDYIREAWKPNAQRAEADVLRITSDGQYLKVVVVDELGVEVELDQRSEGFQWLVSFFIVFFAEAEGKHENAILLLDEPGVQLHGLKQREFRDTLSKLSEKIKHYTPPTRRS